MQCIPAREIEVNIKWASIQSPSTIIFPFCCSWLECLVHTSFDTDMCLLLQNTSSRRGTMHCSVSVMHKKFQYFTACYCCLFPGTTFTFTAMPTCKACLCSEICTEDSVIILSWPKWQFTMKFVTALNNGTLTAITAVPSHEQKVNNTEQRHHSDDFSNMARIWCESLGYCQWDGWTWTMKTKHTSIVSSQLSH